MAHRSNQAVASQERNPNPLEDELPPPRRRLLIGWGTALAALAVSTAGLAAVIWFARFPIAQFILSSALAERGVEADFRLSTLDFGQAVLNDVRVGSAEAPDASIARVEANWDWSGAVPILRSVRFVEPHLRLRLDNSGHVSAGALDHVGGSPSGRRVQIPRLNVTIERGVLQINAPFGPLVADVRAQGTLGSNFSATAQLRETTSARRGYALQAGAGDLLVISRDDSIAFRLNASADSVLWANARVSDFAARVVGRAPLDLSRYVAESACRFGMVRSDELSGNDINVSLNAEAQTRDDSLLAAIWRTRLRANAQRFAFADSALSQARVNGLLNGRDLRAQGRWSVTGETFSGFSLAAARATVDGSMSVDLSGSGVMDAGGELVLGGARLDASARRAIDGALPDAGGTPIGPTFAQARAALQRGARDFALTAPIALHVESAGQRLLFMRPITARSTSGLRFSLAPLRVDAPALTMDLPGATLHGAVDVEFSGGGAPTASLLLDRVTWSPGSPLESDGTLALSHWNTERASIAADELNIGISIGAGGNGRVDLRGPANITGPLGDGEVSNMIANLDIGIAWDAGWRIVANTPCLPIQLGGLDAAGLSFQSGRFALCATNGALAAADARGNLGGGFRIQALALSGHMAGPQGQPARLTAAVLNGQFHGTTHRALLSISATAPALAIDVAPQRVLALHGAQLTADTLLTRDWRIEGQFREGALSDPALPGTVTAIAGHWSAVPESDRAVVRVDAGEALLTANRPASDTERPLFHPLRLNGFAAVLRAGNIDAQGAVVLAEPTRQLAHFTAHHDVDAGIGGAVVTSEALTFDRTLQPYQLSEYARGFVDNVRGPAALTANIDWTRDAISARGLVHLDGVSLATSTIPVIQGVRGNIAFDDLFNLTTPPGQEVTVETLNPGLLVHNGHIRFQLLPEQRVNIERAEFDFAAGTLAMMPTTIPFGAEETRFELSLRNVDASALLATLNIPDLSATGKIDGTFPLVLTRRTALIQNGELHAQPGGGTISYVGHAGDQATGPARIAFDALKSFRYDGLNVALNGDLSGELVSSLQFTGHNSGHAVDLGDIVPIPGIGRVTARGVPFAFHVMLTAPFRSLAETAASISDPTAILHQARDQQTPPVDQPPPAPR
jgi:translocation and assembly module TamB